jgi:alkylation response protein AidB-like acyl-CoA dehydrogenase
MASTTSVFSAFLSKFEQTLHHLFHEKYDIDQLSNFRGLPTELMSGIMATDPLALAVPESFGGRGSSTAEILLMLEKASYESLPLSLLFGINIGLFLYPVSKYGQQSAKENILRQFKNQHMGGLMITEPGYGSDALNMQTSFTESANQYYLKGTKHWQGLTGMAEYWLIAARKNNGDNVLGRDIDLFICDTTKENQKVEVEEYYDAPGLNLIPYGRNKVDVILPAEARLEPHSTGIKMLMDTLHRSRMQFPGMGMGFIKRMLDEAIAHCKKRMVGVQNLLSLDNINYQLARIQSAYTLCAAMCARSSKISGLSRDMASAGLEANSIKAVVTDLMQESAQIMVQVNGANGYRISNVGGRGIMDSRPFQIFEGSNEMLYTQIAEMITKKMKQQKETHLYRFLESFELTVRSCSYFKQELSFNLNHILSQRKLLDLGKILSRVISVGYVLDMGLKGFRSDLIDNCIVMVQKEIGEMISSFKSENKVMVIEDYSTGSEWLKTV